MKRKIGILVAVIAAVALMIGASVAISNGREQNGEGLALFTYDDMSAAMDAIDFSAYNLESIIPADENTGGISEKIEGDSSKAKVLIFEYADYSCSHCAEVNTAINRLVAQYNGEVALVFRTMVIGFPNSISSAAAANAAFLQGYWEKYKNLLFSNQSEWYYLKGEKRDKYFGDLFMEASNGEGNLEKFYEDMASEAVMQRLAFNYGAAEELGVEGTPHFRINGEKVSASDLQNTIDSLLNK